MFVLRLRFHLSLLLRALHTSMQLILRHLAYGSNRLSSTSTTNPSIANRITTPTPLLTRIVRGLRNLRILLPILRQAFLRIRLRLLLLLLQRLQRPLNPRPFHLACQLLSQSIRRISRQLWSTLRPVLSKINMNNPFVMPRLPTLPSLRQPSLRLATSNTQEIGPRMPCPILADGVSLNRGEQNPALNLSKPWRPSWSFLLRARVTRAVRETLEKTDIILLR